jgi:hypothetical protein
VTCGSTQRRTIICCHFLTLDPHGSSVQDDVLPSPQCHPGLLLHVLLPGRWCVSMSQARHWMRSAWPTCAQQCASHTRYAQTQHTLQLQHTSGSTPHLEHSRPWVGYDFVWRFGWPPVSSLPLINVAACQTMSRLSCCCACVQVVAGFQPGAFSGPQQVALLQVRCSSANPSSSASALHSRV